MKPYKDEKSMKEAFASFRKRYTAVDAALLQGEAERLLKTSYPELGSAVKELKAEKGAIKIYFDSPQAASDAMLLRSELAENFSLLLGREIVIDIAF